MSKCHIVGNHMSRLIYNISFITGALSDITGNYIGAFYLAGATILLAGIMCLPLRRITKWEYNKNCRMGVYKNAIDLSSDDSCKLNANKR